MISALRWTTKQRTLAPSVQHCVGENSNGTWVLARRHCVAKQRKCRQNFKPGLERVALRLRVEQTRHEIIARAQLAPCVSHSNTSTATSNQHLLSLRPIHSLVHPPMLTLTYLLTQRRTHTTTHTRTYKHTHARTHTTPSPPNPSPSRNKGGRGGSDAKTTFTLTHTSNFSSSLQKAGNMLTG